MKSSKHLRRAGLATVSGLLLALLGAVAAPSPAGASVAGAAAAAVTGYTKNAAPPPPLPDSDNDTIPDLGDASANAYAQGSFKGVQIAGLFTEVDASTTQPAAACPTVVGVGAVNYVETISSIAVGTGGLSGASPTFSGSTPNLVTGVGNVCSVSGSLTSLTFARAGNVAVALVGLDVSATVYGLDGTTPLLDPAGSGASLSVAVVTATPGAVPTTLNGASTGCNLVSTPECALVVGVVA